MRDEGAARAWEFIAALAPHCPDFPVFNREGLLVIPFFPFLQSLTMVLQNTVLCTLLQSDKTQREKPKYSSKELKNQLNKRLRIYCVVQRSSLEFVMNMPKTFLIFFWFKCSFLLCL